MGILEKKILIEDYAFEEKQESYWNGLTQSEGAFVPAKCRFILCFLHSVDHSVREQVIALLKNKAQKTHPLTDGLND